MGDTIDSIYALIPSPNCKGLCQESCGPIMMSAAEERRLQQRHSFVPGAAFIKKLQQNGQEGCDEVDFTCDGLDQETGKCRVYADRPAVCRLWGVIREMRCSYGCRPAKWLTSAKGHKILASLDRVPMDAPNEQG